ncbi:glycosyltransferase family 4 protein [uncultured Roseivirga sp.]|uniref:glycosyltransferase family 4 protein n=1 Tax=uncultured Roseivirga sp. TaxID=543088 RepID=UPI0030D9200A|tara:strand:- start:5487 stop:6704 length:1218 start_codon:yes stop_codon:yes gene_type:complete
MLDKNIIFITNLHLWSLDKGKGGKAFFYTVQGYIRTGWKIWMVSTGGGIPDDIIEKLILKEEEFPILTRLHNSRFRLVSILGRFLKMNRQNNFYRCTANQIIKENPDKKFIIYGYEVEGVSAASSIANRHSFPLVTRFQGTVIANMENSFLNRLKKAPHFSALSTKANLVIMTNDGTKGYEVLKRLKNKSNRINFWRNGVDQVDKEALFNRDSIRKGLGVEGEIVFITVSRLIGWKRVNLAIEAFAEVFAGNAKTRLIVVGDGPEKRDLENLAEKLKIDERVIFTGAIAQSDVTSYLIASDIFLSLYDLSNLGNPIMEAMRVEKPIITIDVGDTRELIVDGENGVLIPSDELLRIPEMMNTLIMDCEYAKKLALGARKTADKEFWSWQQRIDAEVKEVSQLLELC